MSQSLFVVMICTVAAIGGFLFGFDSAVINGTVDALKVSFGSSDAGTGLAVASVLLGSAVGAFMAGGIADAFGRRPVMVIGSILFAVSAIGCGAAEGVGSFIFWRMVGGLAVGIASAIAPAYIAEVAPAALRGRLGSLQQMATVIGIAVAFLSNYVIAHLAGGASEPALFGYLAWRWMYWVEVIPSVIYGVGACLIPESPRYLVAVGESARAEAILRRVDPGDAAARVAEIKRSLQSEKRPSMRDLLTATGGVQPIVLAGVLLSMFQQFVGINVIFYYGAVLWQSVGFSEADSLMTNVITSGVNIGATIVAIALIDRVGRKPLLLAGSIGMAITLAVMAVVFLFSAKSETGALALSKGAGITALLAANLYVLFFAVSWGPVVWVMLGEMFPNRMRSSALATSAGMQWIANFGITLTFPIILGTAGLGAAYALYAVMAVLSGLFVARFIKETKGKELEEM